MNEILIQHLNDILEKISKEIKLSYGEKALINSYSWELKRNDTILSKNIHVYGDSEIDLVVKKLEKEGIKSKIKLTFGSRPGSVTSKLNVKVSDLIH